MHCNFQTSVFIHDICTSVNTDETGIIGKAVNWTEELLKSRGQPSMQLQVGQLVMISQHFKIMYFDKCRYKLLFLMTSMLIIILK